MNDMTYCWTESGLDSCQKVGAIIARLPAGEPTALLPALPTWDPTQSIHLSSLEKNRVLLTAGRPGQRLVPWGQGSLHWMMFYQVENIPKNSVWRGGQLLQSVKLGLMMASWCGVIVWRWKMWVVQISLSELPEIFWFWKDKQVCDGNKMPWINQSLGTGLQPSVECKTGNAKFSNVCLPVCRHCTIEEWNMLQLTCVSYSNLEICYSSLQQKVKHRSTILSPG